MNICQGREANCYVTPDSGTSSLTMPTWAHTLVDQVIPSNVPCKSDTEFPDLTFILEDVNGKHHSYSLKSREYVEISGSTELSQKKLV